MQVLKPQFERYFLADTVVHQALLRYAIEERLTKDIDFQSAVKEITTNKDIVVLPSDKTSRMIALNTNSYSNILNAATIETGNFEKVKAINPSTHQAYFNRSIKVIAEKYSVSHPEIFKQLDRIKCSYPYPSSCYALPKDHKTSPLNKSFYHQF